MCPDDLDRTRLTPPQHYNQQAKQDIEAKAVAYKAWIVSHTPEQIRIANIARSSLKRRFGLKNDRLIDERTPAKSSAYILFVTDRLTSGEFSGITQTERVKLVSNEWKALNPAEKKVAATHSVPFDTHS